jgi:ATP-dependent exoDNAse (exonuclease V) beta subunit
MLKGDVVFNPKEHTYHLNGKLLRGVSGIVKQFKEEFDSDYWSKRKAKERGVSQEAVLKEWADKAQKACDEGTEFHLHAQFRLEGKGQESSSPKAQAFDRWFKEAGLFIVPVGCEVLLWDETLGIAGTCDLLFYSTKTKLFHILDWKTNGKFEVTNRYHRNLKHPFANLLDCELTGYSIQIGIYKRMAQRLIGCPLGQSWIMHVGEKVTPHRALSIDKQIDTALKSL